MVSGASTDRDRDTAWPQLVPCRGQRLGCCCKNLCSSPRVSQGGLGLPAVSGGCLPVPALQQDALIPIHTPELPLLNCSSPKCRPCSWELLSP